MTGVGVGWGGGGRRRTLGCRCATQRAEGALGVWEVVSQSSPSPSLSACPPCSLSSGPVSCAQLPRLPAPSSASLSSLLLSSSFLEVRQTGLGLGSIGPRVCAVCAPCVQPVSACVRASTTDGRQETLRGGRSRQATAANVRALVTSRTSRQLIKPTQTIQRAWSYGVAGSRRNVASPLQLRPPVPAKPSDEVVEIL